MKVLGISDSDSYTKWGAALLDRMPAGWATSIAVIRTPALVSESQVVTALAGTRFAGSSVPIVDLADLQKLVETERPDVVLLAVRGPVVRVLVRAIVAAGGTRPVIVSGLPGISIPATMLALYYRSQVDVFVLHSKREIAAFGSLADELGITQTLSLARLPFLTDPRPASGGTDIVFAAQAKVPKAEEQRRQLTDWLIATARQRPAQRVVVKLRAVGAEAQTHFEKLPFDTMIAEVGDTPPNLVVSGGPMSDYLAGAAGLVTVSSTAAIEAISMGVPVLVLDSFGVSASMINLVFEGSGLLGGAEALLAGDFRHPTADWLDNNYFHPTADETWITDIDAAVLARSRGELPLRQQFRGSVGGRVRRTWDRKRALGEYDTTLSGYLVLAVAIPLRGAVRRARLLRKRTTRLRA